MSGAENSAGKKRLIYLILDLNFDDWKCFQIFFNAGSKFMFKFDLKWVSSHRHK